MGGFFQVLRQRFSGARRPRKEKGEREEKLFGRIIIIMHGALGWRCMKASKGGGPGALRFRT